MIGDRAFRGNGMPFGSTRFARILRAHAPMLIGAVALFVAIASLTVTLFLRSERALEEQLRETLRAAAVSAAFSIDGDDLASIRGPADMLRPAFVRTASILRNMIDEIPQIRFAYIVRRTDDPSFLEFVVDADAMRSNADLDENGNGIVDPDEEPSYPGELYDVSDIPALQGEAFVRSTTDPSITVDQWGELLSGYAPIRSRATGEVVAVLGIDMDAAEFRSLARGALSPFAALLIVMLAGLLAAGVALLIESRLLQSASRVNAERSGLLQLTFHQLGEPITILQWGIETLEDAKDDAASLQKILPENLVDMREGVRRLGSIIDTLQEAEKVELGIFENKPVEQSIKRTLEEVVSIVSPPTREGVGRVAIDADDGMRVFDPHLLKVVLRRLIENALEYSREHSTVRVRVATQGKWLRIDVMDDGCGIPAADIPHMFEKYRRASNAAAMKPDGNGLGLYIAKGIVEIMGGAISVHSQENVGTTFTILLPGRRGNRA